MSRFERFLQSVFLTESGQIRYLSYIFIFLLLFFDGHRMFWKISEGIIPKDGSRAVLGYIGATAEVVIYLTGIIYLSLTELLIRKKISGNIPGGRILWFVFGVFLLAVCAGISFYAFSSGYEPGTLNFKLMIFTGGFGSGLALALIVVLISLRNQDLKLSSLLSKK